MQWLCPLHGQHIHEDERNLLNPNHVEQRRNQGKATTKQRSVQRKSDRQVPSAVARPAQVISHDSQITCRAFYATSRSPTAGRPFPREDTELVAMGWQTGVAQLSLLYPPPAMPRQTQ